jgi:xylulokinase
MSSIGGVVGWLRRDLAETLGLNREMLLVSGGHDQACAALGSGVVKPGQAMVSTGTAEVVEVAMATPTLNDTLRQGNVSVYRHVAPGLYLAMTLNHSGGLLLRWFRDTCCAAECEMAKATGRDPYDLILADAPDGPTGVFVLPHFAGSGTPWFDTSSKGAFLGLTFAANRATLAKAILEGLTFELRANLDLLKEGGVAIRELHAVGGGARSALWLQLKADVCGVPLRVPEVTEAACLGAALLAGVGAGVYPDLHRAVQQTVRFKGRFEPKPGNASAYEGRYKVYVDIYPTLIPLLRQM